MIEKLMLNKLKKFFDFLKNNQIEYYFLSNNSEFFLEYEPSYSERIFFLINFKSSNINLIFHTNEKKITFITNSRYQLATKIHIDSYLKEDFYCEILIQNKNDLFFVENSQITIESKFFNINSKKLFSNNQKFLESNDDIFDLFMKENFSDEKFPAKNLKEAFLYSEKFSIISSDIKLEKFFSYFNQNYEIDFYFLNDPISICWLLNFRGYDIDYVPIFLCSALFNIKNKSIEIFCEKPEYLAKILNHKIYHEDFLNKRLLNIAQNHKISMSHSASFFLSQYKNQEYIQNPTPYFMSSKNEDEIKLSKICNISDGLSLVYFWFFLSKIDDSLTEGDLSKKIIDLKKYSAKKTNLEYFSESFEPISGFGSNSAIIHYNSNNAKISSPNLFLIDCGSQYFGGTTDITRIFLIKNYIPDQEKIMSYTACLKAHIFFFINKFKKKTKLKEIGELVDQILLKFNLKCPHSYSHGISNFLNVHEGPYSISSIAPEEYLLEKNIIFSNEPGIYFENKFGIRIENMMYSLELDDENIIFKNLSCFFYEPKLIDFSLLTKEEIDFIYNFHKDTFYNLSKYLTSDEKDIIFEYFVNLDKYKSYDIEKLQFDIENLGFRFLYFNEINSTNLYALNLIEKNIEINNNLVILSKIQTNGIGKAKNQWDSGYGGIYMSIIYKIKINISPWISLLIGKIILDIIKDDAINKNLNIKIKWPNDILIDGKKVCGILPVFYKNYLIIGIGINFYENINNSNIERSYISKNIKSLNYYEIIFKIINNLNNEIVLIQNSYDFINNYFLNKIKPKILDSLIKETKYGLIKDILIDGSIDVLNNEDQIINIKSPL